MGDMDSVSFPLCKKTLTSIASSTGAVNFKSPVDSDMYPTYDDVIARRMDLTTVKVTTDDHSRFVRSPSD